MPSNCLAWSVFGFILVAVFAIIGIAIVRGSNHSADPTFTLNNASITSFNLTSDGHFTSFFNITIKAENPHRNKFACSTVRVSIYKDKQDVAVFALDDFTLRKGDFTLLRAEPIATNNVVLGKGPRFDLGVESGMGYVDFDVFVRATLNKDDNLEVNCRHVIVNVTTTTTSGPSPSPGNYKKTTQNFRSVGCSVHIYAKPEW